MFLYRKVAFIRNILISISKNFYGIVNKTIQKFLH